MFTPQNEQGVIVLFAAQAQVAGWEIVEVQTAYPDAVLMKDGELWRAEFEFKARNFVTHSHDFRECDLIICWENDFQECPIPVLELRQDNWTSLGIQKGNPLLNEIEYWRQRALQAERNNKTLVAARIEHPRKSKLPKRVFDDPNQGRQNEVDTRRNALLVLLQQHGDVGDTAFGNMLKVDRTTVYRDLKAMEKAGIVHKNGHGWEVQS